MTQPDENKLNALVGKIPWRSRWRVSTSLRRASAFDWDCLTRWPRVGRPPRLILPSAGGRSPPTMSQWALAQSANGYIGFDPASDKFDLESGTGDDVFRRKGQPYISPALLISSLPIQGKAKVETAFRTGAGVRWGEPRVACSVQRGPYRPGYVIDICK